MVRSCPRVAHVSLIVCAMLAVANAQSITAEIQSITAPLGNATDPVYVVDSDASSAAFGYTRDKMSVSAAVLFSKNTGAFSTTEEFRLSVQLIDVSTGSSVQLASGGTSVVSATESVTVDTFSPTAVRSLSVSVDPGIDLGAGKSYQMRVTVQRAGVVTFPGGSFPVWFTADGPNDAPPFTVIHFADSAAGPEKWVRGYATGGTVWTRSYRMQTDPAKDSFTARVPYFMSRYDLGSTTSSISFRITATLTDDTGANVPLVNNGVTFQSLSMAAAVFGFPSQPSTASGNFTASFEPVAQLDSPSRTFRLRLKIEHLEISPSTYREDSETADTSLRRLLDFNGTLEFGAVTTQIDSLFNNPSAGSVAAGYVNSTVQVGDGSILGKPYSFGNFAALGVRLQSDGDAVVVSGSEPVTEEVAATYGGVKVSYPGTFLSSSGATAGNVVVNLPQGLGYTPARAAARGRYLSTVDLGVSIPLEPNFEHLGSLSMALGGDAWVFDEARPLQYAVSDFSFLTSGEIQFVASDSEWIHSEAYDLLEANQATGLHESPAMAYRLSNDGFLRFSTITSPRDVVFTAAGDGTARTASAEIDITPGEFRSHFPVDTEVAWNSAGLGKIAAGVFEKSSVLGSSEPVSMEYDGSCEDDPCGPAAGAATNITGNSMTGNFLITRDGGVYAPIAIPSQLLMWGIKGDGGGGIGNHTHRTDKFESGELFVPGNQIYAADNTLFSSAVFAGKEAEMAPGLVMLAGYQEDGAGEMIYPETPEYADGEGAYGGFTMAVDPSQYSGGSFLADMASEYEYSLQSEISKYYIRRSGLSGRHVAEEGSFPTNAVLYGYKFELNRFQLTYLSNENEESWVSGALNISYPSGFSLLFSGLRLSCTGALEGADLDPEDSGPKPLSYWNGEFSPMAMEFRPETGAGCYADRFLTLGVVSGAANIPTPLAGTLAFKPNGNIATLTDAVEGVDGRLGLPAKILMDGPGDESYPLYPVNKLYFNNPNAGGAPASGYVNFAATCNIPFFEDLKVHCMTSAQAGIPASLYLADGWTSGSDTFFTNINFDGAHRGFPASGTTVANYQNPSEETAFVVRAKQSIFGLVDLDYPLRWSPTSRFFTSWEAETSNLLVLKVEHQVDYLSAENAELSFGAQYEGLPQINLVNTAYDAVEERIGAARALTEAASQFVTDTLNEGVDEIGQLASDNIEKVLDEALDEMEEDVIDPLYEAVVTSYNDAVAANEQYGDWVDGSSGDLKVVFDRYLDGLTGPPADSIKGRLNDLSDAASSASNLVSRVDDALVRGILAIDSVTGELQTYRNGADVIVGLSAPPGYTADSVISGILKEVSGPGGTLERQIVQTLVQALISELAPEDLAAVLDPLLADAASDLNDQLNELLIEFDPTLDRVTEALLEARSYLVEIRSKLQVGQELITNFQEIVSNASAEIDAIIAGIRNRAYSFIDHMADGATYLPNTVLGEAGALIEEFDKEEFVATIRAEVRDRLMASSLIQQVQFTLRQYISELDLAMKSAIDSAFGEVNRLCKELIKEALGPIDEAINGLVGDVEEYLGAGSVDGYAHIQNDTLRKLRLDAKVQFKVPEEMTLQAYFEMNCYDSQNDGGSGCVGEGDVAVEVKIGALDVPLDWVSPDVRADLEVRFTMQTSDPVIPLGLGGSLAMTSGEIDFQGLTIKGFGASVGVGLQECYLAATARVVVSSYEAAGGIFFGRTCTIEPLLLVDPDVGELLGAAPFTGAYVYGEVWIPISEVLLGIPSSCLFRISAGVGAGAFYFVEGPTFGGKMLMGVSGEALCIVSIRGELAMTGVMSGGSLKFKGRGTLTGKAGYCPFCVKFKESASVTYQGGSWSVDL